MASPFYDSWALLKRRSDTAHIEDERRLEQRPGYPHNLVSQAKKPDFVRNPSGPGFYEDPPKATLMTDERYEAPSETQLQSVKEGNVERPLNFETEKYFNRNPDINSGDDSRFTVETGHPMEIAFRLLKNVMDYGEVAGELPEPNPLDAALARARNQGPAPGANLKRLPPKPHFTEDIKQFMAQNPDAPGNQPLGQPLTPPMPPQ